jgi:hypothetical protein
LKNSLRYFLFLVLIIVAILFFKNSKSPVSTELGFSSAVASANDAALKNSDVKIHPIKLNKSSKTNSDDDSEDSYKEPPLLEGKELEEALRNNDICKIARSKIGRSDHIKLTGMEKDEQIVYEILTDKNNLNYFPDPSDPLRILFLKTLAMSGLINNGPHEIQPSAEEMWRALMQRDPDNGAVYAYYACYQNQLHENQSRLDETLGKMIRSSRFETQMDMYASAQQSRLRALPPAMYFAGFYFSDATSDRCLLDTLPDIVATSAPEVKAAVGNWVRTFSYFRYTKDDSLTSAFMIPRTSGISQKLEGFGTVPERPYPPEFDDHIDKRIYAEHQLIKDDCNPQPILDLFASEKAHWEKTHANAH